jgi:hypothetical protein
MNMRAAPVGFGGLPVDIWGEEISRMNNEPNMRGIDTRTRKAVEARGMPKSYSLPSGARALRLTFRKEDVDGVDGNRFDGMIARVIEDTFGNSNHLASLEDLSIDFSALAVHTPSEPWQSRFGMAGDGTEENKIRHWGTFRTLASRSFAPAMHTLWLELKGNEVGEQGALALGELRFSPVLKKLHLGLKNNRIDVHGARALSKLSETPALECLYLELEDNNLCDEGALALCDLDNGNPWRTWSPRENFRADPSLRTLHLGLKNNGIGDLGARALGRMARGSYALRHLHVNLDNNLIDRDTVELLLSLVAPTLIIKDIQVNNQLQGPKLPQFWDDVPSYSAGGSDQTISQWIEVGSSAGRFLEWMNPHPEVRQINYGRLRGIMDGYGLFDMDGVPSNYGRRTAPTVLEPAGWGWGWGGNSL